MFLVELCQQSNKKKKLFIATLQTAPQVTLYHIDVNKMLTFITLP